MVTHSRPTAPDARARREADSVVHQLLVECPVFASGLPELEETDELEAFRRRVTAAAAHIDRSKLLRALMARGRPLGFRAESLILLGLTGLLDTAPGWAALEQAARHRDWSVRMRAAWVASWAGHRDGQPLIEWCALNDSNESVRGDCADYLGVAANTDSARATLRQMVRDDRSPYVVFSAALALWDIGTAEDATTMSERLGGPRVNALTRAHLMGTVYLLTGEVDQLVQLIRDWSSDYGTAPELALQAASDAPLAAGDTDAFLKSNKNLWSAKGWSAELTLWRLDGHHNDIGLAQHARIDEVCSTLRKAVGQRPKLADSRMPALFRTCGIKPAIGG